MTTTVISRALHAVRRGDPWAVDLALAAAVTLLAEISAIVLVAPASPDAPPTPAIAVWAVALTAPLVLRRRFPVTVLAVTAVHFWFYWATGRMNEIASWVTLGVALYSAAAYGRRPLAARVCVLLGAMTVVATVALGLMSGRTTPAQLAALVLFNLLPFAVAWPLGAMMRSLRATRAELVERNRELDEQRRTNARRAVAEERVRIARELHDAVAHHVSVVGVQAGVARSLFARRPDQAMEAITAVEAASRDAITELHQIVGLLRRDDDGGDRAPQPDLAQLPALVAQMRAAGLRVDHVVDGHTRRHPPGVERSAYRIVQEALTNVLKHAGPTHAVVRITHDGDGVAVEVTDDGGAPRRPDGPETGGTGLVGMRERVSLHGGHLEAGPLDGGGFRVHAVLPDVPPDDTVAVGHGASGRGAA